MSEWAEFYAGRMGSRYKQHVRQKYAPFLQCITLAGESVARRGHRPVFREEGCGIGTVTAVLRSDVPYRADYRMFDNDSEQVQRAIQNTGLFCDESDILLPQPERVDVVHSHGVLEHFSDSSIRRILERQLCETQHAVVHYVPSSKYSTPSFGDERLMTLWEWRRIAKPTHSFDFNDGHDLCLLWIK